MWSITEPMLIAFLKTLLSTTFSQMLGSDVLYSIIAQFLKLNSKNAAKWHITSLYYKIDHIFKLSSKNAARWYITSLYYIISQIFKLSSKNATEWCISSLYYVIDHILYSAWKQCHRLHSRLFPFSFHSWYSGYHSLGIQILSKFQHFGWGFQESVDDW